MRNRPFEIHRDSPAGGSEAADGPAEAAGDGVAEFRLDLVLAHEREAGPEVIAGRVQRVPGPDGLRPRLPVRRAGLDDVAAGAPRLEDRHVGVGEGMPD